MSKNIVKLITGVAGVVLLSRILGFVREMIIAHNFGTTADYDLYLIAVMLPALAYGVINFSTVYLFVPFLSKKKAHDTGEISWADIWPSFNLVVGSALLVALLIIFGAPLIMKIWAADYSPESFERIIWYARLTSLMLIFGTTEAFMRAYLNVKKIFLYPAGGYIVYNLFSIFIILFFSASLSTGAIVLGLLGGQVVQTLYLLLRVLKFDPFQSFRLKFINVDTTAVLKAGLVIILIEIMNRSYFLIDRYVALNFGEGVISALNYSQVLVQLPESIVGFAIGAVMFPFFSDSATVRDDEKFGAIFYNTIIPALMLSLPLAIFFYHNAADLVTLLFNRGKFDQNSVLITTAVLKPYVISVAALFVINTSLRAIYSKGWLKQILSMTIIVLVFKYVGNFILSDWFGYPGISLATALSHLLFALLMIGLILFKIKSKLKRQFVIDIVKLVVSGVAIWFVAFYPQDYLLTLIGGRGKIDILLRLIVSGIFLLALYLLIIYLLGMSSHIKKALPGRSTDER